MSWTVEWVPGGGGAPVVIASHGDADFILTSLEGFGSTRSSPLTRRGPGQVGATLVDRVVDTRTVAAQVIAVASSREELADREAALIRALAVVPGGSAGLLRVTRSGRVAVETRAEPQDSPRFVRWYGTAAAAFDLEWLCPSPLWRETADRIVTFRADDEGWEAPWEAPWHAVADAAEQEITNPGDVPVPFVVTFHGEQNTARLVRVDTGERIEVVGAIPAGESVEVDTGVERRAVTDVDALGQRSNSLASRWNHADGRFLTLPPGLSRWRWEANERTVGSWADAEAATFSRASTAYLDGVEVPSGVPRYPGDTSILVEEGTTNGVSAAASEGTGHIAGSGATVTLGSTEQAWRGGSSCKVVTVGTGAAEGTFLTIDGRPGVAAGQVWTGSAWVFAPAGVSMQARIVERDSSSGVVQTGAYVPFTGTGGWQRVIAGTLTAAGSGSMDVNVRTVGTQAVTFFVDGHQLEQKAYATQWHPGGATRAADDLSLPVGTVSASEGTVEIDVNLTHSRIVPGARIFHATRTTGTNGLMIYWENGWRLHVTNDSGSAAATVAQLLSDGHHRFAVAWDSAGVRFLLDGALIGTINASYLPAAFESFHLGMNPASATIRLNNPIDGMRVSRRARSNDELADWQTPLTADGDTTWAGGFNSDLTAKASPYTPGASAVMWWRPAWMGV